MSALSAADRMARLLRDRFESGQRTTCAWLNHYTALEALDAGVDLSSVDIVALDGQLLIRLLRKSVGQRTSADTVLPTLLDIMPPSRIALVGGTDVSKTQFLTAFAKRWPQHTIAYAKNGYDERPEPEQLAELTRQFKYNVVVIGLGAPMQEHYLNALSYSTPTNQPVLAFTCGGWMDQFSEPSYYPAWAYPLGLTWAVRLAREPRRLWKRYTVDGVSALVKRNNLRNYVKPTPWN